MFAIGAHICFAPCAANEVFLSYRDAGRCIDAKIEACMGGTPDMPTEVVVMRLFLSEDVAIDFGDERPSGRMARPGPKGGPVF